MAALEAGIEWLRPLANSQPWDYCVIWKLGDDPSRFIEWGGCCCSGGRRDVGAGNGNGIKIMKSEDDFVEECKDSAIKHPVTSDACKKLASLPSVIPLYSGIHGDVVISKRPRWITDASLSSDEQNGTQVLIPVTCGLIELFTTKHVARDEKMIDFISAGFRVPFKQESMMENNYQENWPPSSSSSPSPLNYLNLSQPTNYSSFEGSSTCSSLSDELQFLQLGPDHVLSGIEQSSKDYADSPSRNLRMRRNKPCGDGNEKVSIKLRQKSEKGPFKSKNLMTERNRRKRIKDGELALRALVPKITKMDRTATLMDAADYIRELLETVRNYREELEALEDEDCKEGNTKPEHQHLMMVRDCADNKASENTLVVVEVEVNQLGMKDFLVKIICKQKHGAFSRLVQVIDSLGLQVADANVTTLHGLVSNVFKVEAMRADLDPTTLKHSLVHLVTY